MKLSIIQMDPYWLIKEKNNADKNQSGKITFNSSQHSVSIFFGSSKASLVLRRTEELSRFSLSDDKNKMNCSLKANKTEQYVKWFSASKEEVFRIISKKFVVKIMHNDSLVAKIRFVTKKNAIITIQSTNTFPIPILIGSFLPLIVGN